MPQAESSDWKPAVIRPYQRGSALYCLFVAAAIGVLAHFALLRGHNLTQIAPFLAHLVLNGFLLGVVAASHSPETSWLLHSRAIRLSSFFLTYGLGIVGLFLAGRAAFDLTSSNAPALLLIVPGISGLLPVFTAPEEKYVGPEVLNEVPRVPLGPLLTAFSGSVVRQTIGWTLVLAGSFLLFEWYFVLRQILWSGAHYELVSLAENNLRGALQAWPALIPLSLVGLVVELPAWGPLLREGIRERLGLVSLSSDQRAVVRERLQRLWDYANAPEQEGGSIAGLLLPLVPAIILIGLAFLLITKSESLADWLFPPSSTQPTSPWSLVVRDSSPMIWPILLLFPVAWSLYRLGTDHWPRALQQALVSDLQRGPALNPSKVRALRRDISLEVRRGKPDSTVSPREYLLRRRRRSSRRLHTVSVVALLLALLISWRCLASYTLAYEGGFDSVDFLTGRHFSYSYSDVASVRPECFLGRNKDVAYQIAFRDGRHADLLFAKDLPAHLPSLKLVDQELRRSQTVFHPLADSPTGVQKARECVRTLGSEYGDSQGFAQIMHVDTLTSL